MKRVLQQLERRLAPWAVPNLTELVIASQVTLFGLGIYRPDFREPRE